MLVSEHILCGKIITCKEHLLKAEIDEIRPLDQTKYGHKFTDKDIRVVKQPSNPTGSNMQKISDSSNTGENKTYRAIQTANPSLPIRANNPNNSKNNSAINPPPLGDIQRALDPRVQAFREQGQARMTKYKVDYRSDLRDVKFNTKPHYDFYFSAPD